MGGSGATVLLVDDDPIVREVVARYLTRDGHRPLECADGPSALTILATQEVDLVVLDLMLPGMDGLTVCAEIRRTSAVPVILLTARGAEADRIAGLQRGADDYVVKPFSPRELALRVAALLRRSRSAPAPSTGSILEDGNLRLDPAARSAWRDGVDLSLTVREFDLLQFFLRNPGRAFSRAEIMEKVWNWSFGDTSTVTVHVRRLREKIEADPADPQRIATVWGTGYRFQAAGAIGDPGAVGAQR